MLVVIGEKSDTLANRASSFAHALGPGILFKASWSVSPEVFRKMVSGVRFCAPSATNLDPPWAGASTSTPNGAS